MCNMNTYLLMILVSMIAKFLQCNAQLFGESTRTTLSLIADYDYPAEEHKVQTADDYILTLYRIPYSPKNNSTAATSERAPVFLMHGFADSSSAWVISGYPRSLAFYLSDEGFDVWLGNARGTRYSKQHAHLSTNNPKYWDFSWHEIGVSDIPANVDYILKHTANTQLHYIGHSQGTVAFFAGASSLPELNEKIKTASLLAPAAFIYHATSPIFPVLGLLVGGPHPLLLGAFELLPSSAITQELSKILCDNSSVVQSACKDFAGLMYGQGSEHTNSSALQIYFEAAPAGVSVKQLYHYAQSYRSQKFRQFNYGFIKNEFEYAQLTPPDYALGNITAPLYLYHSENDAFADPADVQLLVDALQPNTVKKVHKMAYESWNHIDFILGNNVDELLYRTVLEDINAASLVEQS